MGGAAIEDGEDDGQSGEVGVGTLRGLSANTVRSARWPMASSPRGLLFAGDPCGVECEALECLQGPGPSRRRGRFGQIPAGAAVPGSGHDGQRWIGRDGPVGAQDDSGAGVPKVPAAEGVGGALLAEAAGPVVGVVGAGELTAVRGLHGGGDAQPGEAAQGGSRRPVARAPYGAFREEVACVQAARPRLYLA